jgi:hypothetical protein
MLEAPDLTERLDLDLQRRKPQRLKSANLKMSGGAHVDNLGLDWLQTQMLGWAQTTRHPRF